MNALTLIDRIFDEYSTSCYSNNSLRENNYLPRVDIRELKDKFQMDVDLPGMTSDNIKIEFKDGILNIEGERKFQDDNEIDGFYKRERSFGKFSRSFNFGKSVDESKIEAQMENGVLRIELSKSEEKKSKLIKIS